MKQNKHTPGPWKVYKINEWSKECGNGGEGFSSSFWVGAGETEWKGPEIIVDFVKPWTSLVLANRELVHEAEANAHLIAAAPEMYSILNRIWKLMHEPLMTKTTSGNTATIEFTKSTLEEIDRVIKKAKGA